MPSRPKKQKKKPREFFKYNEESVVAAVKAVLEDGMSQKQASKTFAVPRATLQRKLKGNLTPRKMGPATILSTVEEAVLEEWLIGMARKGFPVHRRNLINTVQNIILETKHDDNPFKDGKPGRTWFTNFLKRHPRLKEMHAENITKARASVSKEGIERWFGEVTNYLEEEGHLHIMQDPARIFNADESGFMMCPKTDKVIGCVQRNGEDFYKEVSNDEKAQITVMGMFSADGKCVPPMVIYPYKKIPEAIVRSVPSTWGVGKSDSGWMNSEVFYEYIANHFIPYLDEEGMDRPVVLFVDGHRSHLSKQVSQLCDKNGIVLVALHPNSTHILQPADVSVFKPLKTGWKAVVCQWKFENFPQELTKATFGKLISKTFSEKVTPECIKNGFRACGLYPFDKNGVDYTKCMKNRNVANPLKPVDENVGQTKSDFSVNAHNCLPYLEDKIGPDRMGQFLKTYAEGNEWKGPVEAVELFNLWKAIKIEFTVNLIEPEQDSLEDLDEPVAEKSSVVVPVKELIQTPKGAPVTVVRCHSDPGPSSKGNEVLTFQQRTSKNQLQHVSSPFKKCLAWPKTPEKPLLGKRKREVFPAVVSSAKWREYYVQKEAGKKGKKKSTPALVKAPLVGEPSLNKKEYLTKKKKKSSQTQSDSETEAEEWVESGCSDDDLSEGFEGICNRARSTVEKHTPNTDKSVIVIEDGMYVLASFVGKTLHRSVCIVQSVANDSEAVVMAMKPMDGSKTVFLPNEDDISTINHTQVISILDEPRLQQSGSRVKYVFNKAVDVTD